MLEGREVHKTGIIAETEFLGHTDRPQLPDSYAGHN